MLDRTGCARRCENNVDFLRQLLYQYTDVGDVVVDLCCGTGSFGEAAVAMNRVPILCDQDDEVLKVAGKRVENFVTEHLSELVSLGELFLEPLVLGKESLNSRDTTLFEWRQVLVEAEDSEGVNFVKLNKLCDDYSLGVRVLDSSIDGKGLHAQRELVRGERIQIHCFG